MYVYVGYIVNPNPLLDRGLYTCCRPHTNASISCQTAIKAGLFIPPKRLIPCRCQIKYSNENPQ